LRARDTILWVRKSLRAGHQIVGFELESVKEIGQGLAVRGCVRCSFWGNGYHRLSVIGIGYRLSVIGCRLLVIGVP
jgi:hypothetical protein